MVKQPARTVIPAKAGIQKMPVFECFSAWIPAFAGMKEQAKEFIAKRARQPQRRRHLRGH
jgi:hypothetical protein